ncbi:uncharacterized protein LOC144205643 [Stigmatopora nigra]
MEPDILTYQHATVGPPLDDDIREAGSGEKALREISRGLANPSFHHKANGEEGGFADFAVFAEQAGHPWCCGFVGATTPSNILKDPRDVVTDSEPRPCHRHLTTLDVPRASPASEDPDSPSLEGASEDSGPNLSSLASYEDCTDDEQMMDHMCVASQGTYPTSSPSSKPTAFQSLPQSDSFADFCSAATQQDLGEMWAQIKERDDHTDQLLQASFPHMDAPPKCETKEENEKEGIPNLEVLLYLKQLPDCESAHPGFYLPCHDLRDATGLKFKWGTSHANRRLLTCLGMLAEPKKDRFPQTPTLGPCNQRNSMDQARLTRS